MKKFLIITITVFFIQLCNAQTDPIDYFGQTPPGDMPIVFAPGVISRSDSIEERLVISNDGKWLFYNQRNLGYTYGQMMYMKYENGSWGQPERATFFDELNSSGNPSFSPDGRRLFFDGRANGINTYNPFVMERTDDSTWAPPETLNIEIPNPSRSSDNVCGPNITDDSTLYFSMQMDNRGQKFDIYRSGFINGEYQLAELIIRNAGEDCFVARDNSYILFNKYFSGYGVSDIFVAFRKTDGTWTSPKNLGPEINTNTFSYYPVLSPDYKYLFFSRYPDNNCDIYWVKIDELIDSLKIASGLTSIEDLSLERNIIVFPNPTAGLVTISIGTIPVQESFVEIYSSQGNLVFSETYYNTATATIDLSGFSTGIYLVKVMADENSYEEKLILK